MAVPGSDPAHLRKRAQGQKPRVEPAPKKTITPPKIKPSSRNPVVNSSYQKEAPKDFMKWLIGLTNIDFFSYAPRLVEIAKKIGIDGEENLARIFKMLEACSSRIMYENDNFIILTMAIMLVESKWNPDVVNAGTGAAGIMQVKPIAALDTLLKMDDLTLDDFERYVVPTLSPEEQASWVVLKINVFYIKDLDASARKVKKGQEGRLAEIRQQLKTSKEQAMQIISQSGMLKNPTFCTGMGIFLLARLIESHKQNPGKRADMNAVVGALKDYGGDVKAGYYSTKVLRAFWLITEYPNAITLILEGKLPINTALDLMDAGSQGKKVMQEILFFNRNPDDGIRFVKGLPIRPIEDAIPTTL